MASLSIRSYIPNLLSTTRVVLVPYAFFCPAEWRLPFVVLLILTDFFDGFLARRWRVISRYGTLVDPIGDKGVALAFAYLFWSEGLMSSQQVIMFFSREWALLVFGAYLFFQGRWRSWNIQSFWCGKAATVFQAVIGVMYCLQWPVPHLAYGLLVTSGMAALPELIYRAKHIGQPVRTDSTTLEAGSR